MMTSRLLRSVGVLALLGLGLLFVQLFPRVDGRAASDFGGLWLGRPSDLILQMCLMFVGALGIRALLPSGHEED